MGNIKFALDTGPDATGNSWLKYVRSAPSFEEQNLAACHLTGDQVSDMTEMSCLDLWPSGTVLSARGRNEGGWGRWVDLCEFVRACLCVSTVEVAKCVRW